MKADTLPKELMTAFGRFMAAWSEFEYALARRFSEAVGGPLQRNLMIFYSSTGYAPRRDLNQGSHCTVRIRARAEATFGSSERGRVLCWHS